MSEDFMQPPVFKALMDAMTTRIKGGIPSECDETTVNMYYQTVALRVDADELMQRYEHLYHHWEDYRLPSPEEWLSAGEVTHQTNRDAYRQVRASDRPALPEPKLSNLEKAEQQKRNRIRLLAGIYQVEGDSPFYRDMLAGQSQSWGGVISALTGHQGEICHEEVLAQVTQGAVP